jgi:tryptophan-rich sensory protein
LAGFVALPLLVGVTASIVTVPVVRGWYASLNRPPGTPPDWVFGPVWTVLYVLMGVAAWLVWRARQGGDLRPLRLWGWQLLVNAGWSPAFFGLHSPGLGLAVILLLLLLAAGTAIAFRAARWQAGALMIPYVAWVCYAAYLNAGFLALNT